MNSDNENIDSHLQTNKSHANEKDNGSESDNHSDSEDNYVQIFGH
jgi:hypothetical protein